MHDESPANREAFSHFLCKHSLTENGGHVSLISSASPTAPTSNLQRFEPGRPPDTVTPGAGRSPTMLVDRRSVAGAAERLRLSSARASTDSSS